MAKILCANNYYYRYDQKQWKFAQPYPPLGTLYAVAVLEQAGFDTSFYDNNLVNSHQEMGIFQKHQKVADSLRL